MIHHKTCSSPLHVHDCHNYIVHPFILQLCVTRSYNHNYNCTVYISRTNTKQMSKSNTQNTHGKGKIGWKITDDDDDTRRVCYIEVHRSVKNVGAVKS